MVTIFQYQAKIARMVRDRPALLSALQAMRDAALASGFPAVILLADRVAELRAKYRSSPLPPPLEDTSRTRPVAEEESGQDLTAGSTFLRGFEFGDERCRHALRLLAQCAVSDEAYLFISADEAVSVVAALDAREAPEELKFEVRQLMRTAREDNGLVVEISRLRSRCSTQGEQRKRFRVILLPASGSGDELWVGAAAVCESHDNTEHLPMELVVDIGRVLSEDLRSEQITRARH